MNGIEPVSQPAPGSPMVPVTSAGAAGIVEPEVHRSYIFFNMWYFYVFIVKIAISRLPILNLRV
jgi:hypothetical protein